MFQACFSETSSAINALLLQCDTNAGFVYVTSSFSRAFRERSGVQGISYKRSWCEGVGIIVLCVEPPLSAAQTRVVSSTPANRKTCHQTLSLLVFLRVEPGALRKRLPGGLRTVVEEAHFVIEAALKLIISRRIPLHCSLPLLDRTIE